MAVRDFFQKEEVEEEEEEVEAVEELTVDGRSLRDDEEEEEKEGLSRGLLRGCSVAAGDGEGSGRERRRRAEGSRESALWSVTMSRARAASPASPPRGWSPPPPPPPWWWGKRDDIASGAWALGWVGGFPGGDLKRAARPATWGRRTDTDKGERSGGCVALVVRFVLLSLLVFHWARPRGRCRCALLRWGAARSVGSVLCL